MKTIFIIALDLPIPMRDFDYCAMFRDHEFGDPQGYGRTERVAVDNLFAAAESRARPGETPTEIIRSLTEPKS